MSITRVQFREFSSQICSGCGTIKPKNCCSACKIIFYCSRACQKKDWKFHKVKCKNLKELDGSDLKSYLLANFARKNQIKPMLSLCKLLDALKGVFLGQGKTRKFIEENKELVECFSASLRALKLKNFLLALLLKDCSNDRSSYLFKLFFLLNEFREKKDSVSFFEIDNIQSKDGIFDYDKLDIFFEFVFKNCNVNDISVVLKLLNSSDLEKMDGAVEAINDYLRNVEKKFSERKVGRVFPIGSFDILNFLSMSCLDWSAPSVREFIINKTNFCDYLDFLNLEYRFNNKLFEMFEKAVLKKSKRFNLKVFCKSAEEIFNSCKESRKNFDPMKASKAFKLFVGKALRADFSYVGPLKIKRNLLRQMLKDRLLEVDFAVKFAIGQADKNYLKFIFSVLVNLSNLEESLEEYINGLFFSSSYLKLFKDLFNNSYSDTKGAFLNQLFVIFNNFIRNSNFSHLFGFEENTGNRHGVNLAFLSILSSVINFPGACHFRKILKDEVVKFDYLCDGNMGVFKEKVFDSFRAGFSVQKIVGSFLSAFSISAIDKDFVAAIISILEKKMKVIKKK